MKKQFPKLPIKKLPLNLKSSKNSAVILLAFLLAVNFLVSQKFLYIDLTQDKIYTASDVSGKILGDLKNPVNVTFYISKDLPSDYVNYKTQIQDILGQYYDLSKGKLNIKYEEPGNDDKTVQDMAEKGIPQVQSQVVARDKVELKNFFFGAEITSGEGSSQKKEVLATLPALESFEYNFISAVNSVSKDQKETVAFLSGHGEKDMVSGTDESAQNQSSADSVDELKKSYEVYKVIISTEEGKSGFYVDNGSSSQETSDATKPQAPAEKKFVSPQTIIIAGPQNKFTDQEIAVLDAFVAGGGKVIVLSEKINPDLQKGFVTKNIDTNISDFTKKYGIEINNDLVYDRSNLPITYTKQTYFGMMQMTNNYPFWVKAVKEGFSGDPSLSKVQSLDFLWASSLNVRDANGYKVANLITSSGYAQTISDNINISPETNLMFTNVGVKTIAAVSTAQGGSGKVIVVGDSDFVFPSFMQSIPDNETFFLNLVDSVSSSANLSSIRSKNISERPLKDLTENEKNYWKFFAIGGGAILFCAYGFVRISKRRKLSKGS